MGYVRKCVSSQLCAFSKSKWRDFAVFLQILTPLSSLSTVVLYNYSSSVFFHFRLSTGATFDAKTAVEGHWVVTSAPYEDSVILALKCVHLSE